MAKLSALSRGEFKKTNAWGLLTSVDIHGCNPIKIRNEEIIKDFTEQLCKKIKVRTFGKIQLVRFGDDPRVCGYSMTQLIQTSLVSAHFAEENNSVYLDVFSCRFYDANEVVNFSLNFFEGTGCNAHCILRGGRGVIKSAKQMRLGRRNIILQK